MQNSELRLLTIDVLTEAYEYRTSFVFRPEYKKNFDRIIQHCKQFESGDFDLFEGSINMNIKSPIGVCTSWQSIDEELAWQFPEFDPD